ncbi:MAG: hypothetical protein H7335_17505 [Massilia sp.]|nr:hypothetical protein [Massilia sp.]
MHNHVPGIIAAGHSNAVSMEGASGSAWPPLVTVCSLAGLAREATAIMHEIAHAGREQGRASAAVWQTLARLDVLAWRRGAPPRAPAVAIVVAGSAAVEAPAGLRQALSVLNMAIHGGRQQPFLMRVGDFVA